MSKRIQPRLNQPKDVVIRHALQGGAREQAKQLLQSLSLVGCATIYSSAELMDMAAGEAADLHDFCAMLGRPFTAEWFIDSVLKVDKNFAPHRDQALALVAEMDRCVAKPKRRAA